VPAPKLPKLPNGLASHVSMRGLAMRVAKAAGETPHNVEMRIRRQLLRWLAWDVQRGLPAVWMYRAPHSKTWRINLTALRAAHPEFFEDASPVDMQAEIEQLKADAVERQWREDAMADQVGKLAGRIAVIEGRLGL
jgi:hypothetical protein